MNWMQLIIGAMSFILGGGLTGFFASLLKVRAEAGRIVIDAAQGAVIVQSKVIDELRNELIEARKEVTEIRKELKNISKHLNEVMSENESLHRRIAGLIQGQDQNNSDIRKLNVHKFDANKH